MKAEVLQQVETEMNAMKESMGDVQTKMNEYHPNTEGICALELYPNQMKSVRLIDLLFCLFDYNFI